MKEKSKMKKTHSYETKSNRKNEILELLEKNRTLRVSDLSRLLNTSVVTIRKDLDELEQTGALTRTHGGAVKNPALHNEYPSCAQREKNREAKMAIASAVADLIHDGESLFINVGSTCSYVCEELRQKNNLILITNSLTLFNQISSYDNATLFFLGGRYDSSMQITVGDDVLAQLSKYTADKLIMGMDGVDPVAGATSFNHTEDLIMHQMIAQAHEKILVVDDSKIGKVAFAHIADLNKFDILVTNYNKNNIPKLNEIERLGLRVIVV